VKAITSFARRAKIDAICCRAALYFEDQLTMQYQVQEMLRLEQMFEPEPIQDELDVYTPPIPDGCN
jgi:hypothetical protein